MTAGMSIIYVPIKPVTEDRVSLGIPSAMCLTFVGCWSFIACAWVETNGDAQEWARVRVQGPNPRRVLVLWMAARVSDGALRYPRIVVIPDSHWNNGMER